MTTSVKKNSEKPVAVVLPFSAAPIYYTRKWEEHVAKLAINKKNQLINFLSVLIINGKLNKLLGAGQNREPKKKPRENARLRSKKPSEERAKSCGKTRRYRITKR
jgi:hypothetical protein